MLPFSVPADFCLFFLFPRSRTRLAFYGYSYVPPPFCFSRPWQSGNPSFFYLISPVDPFLGAELHQLSPLCGSHDSPQSSVFNPATPYWLDHPPFFFSIPDGLSSPGHAKSSFPPEAPREKYVFFPKSTISESPSFFFFFFRHIRKRRLPPPMRAQMISNSVM